MNSGHMHTFTHYNDSIVLKGDIDRVCDIITSSQFFLEHDMLVELIDDDAYRHDDREIVDFECSPHILLGNSPVREAVTITMSDWMSFVPSESLLSDISIPGTHDTGAIRLVKSHSRMTEVGPVTVPVPVPPAYYQCQCLPLVKLLEIGVRFLDIRCRLYNNTFRIHHDDMYMELTFGVDVRDVCIDFLKKHPHETIIMSVKREYSTYKSSNTFEQTFMKYVNDNDPNHDFWYFGDTIPKLGDVRGKIVLLRRFDGHVGIDATHGWKDDACSTITGKAVIEVQDRYQFGSKSEILHAIKAMDYYKEKTRVVEDMLVKSSKSPVGSGHLFLNFASATIPRPPVDYARDVNRNIASWMKDVKHKNGRYGIVILDFAGRHSSQLVNQIVNSNFA